MTHYGAILLEMFLFKQKYEIQSNSENKKFLLNLIDKKKITYDSIEPKFLQTDIVSFQKGSLLLIYDNIVLLCRKGNNNLSLMIPNIQLQNLSFYLNKYLI